MVLSFTTIFYQIYELITNRSKYNENVYVEGKKSYPIAQRYVCRKYLIEEISKDQSYLESLNKLILTVSD